MAFRANKYQQISIEDEFNRLSPKTKKIVEQSWAKDFADIVFPAINEERFAVLYSDNKASRSNTPVNFIVGALMLKTMLGLTDDEIFESICCDIRFKYALHSTSFEEQPINDRTFSRFRERLYNHEIATGETLLDDEMKSLAEKYMKFMNLHTNIKRMDSMMIATSAKHMSRLEILYNVNANAVKLMHELGADEQIPSGLEHYLDKEDHNEVIYYCKDEDASSRLEKAIKEAEQLRKAMDSDLWFEYSQYQLLIRVLNEQTTLDDDGNRRAKGNKEISPTSVQTTTDPDATFRMKAGKAHKGYVGNFVESVGEEGQGLITDFELQKNNHSDSEFCKDQIRKHSHEDSTEILIVDGAYGGSENQRLAEEHNVELVATALTGKAPNPIFADFEFDTNETTVVSCPNGCEPQSSKLYEKTGMIRVLMPKEACEHCPNREKCGVSEQKANFSVVISTKMVRRSQYLKKLSTEEYLQLTRMRNAIEGIPSVLRRKYNVDHGPFRGIIKTGWMYALSVGAYNIVKLLKYRQKPRDYYAQIPALT